MLPQAERCKTNADGHHNPDQATRCRAGAYRLSHEEKADSQPHPFPGQVDRRPLLPSIQ